MEEAPEIPCDAVSIADGTRDVLSTRASSRSYLLGTRRNSGTHEDGGSPDDSRRSMHVRAAHPVGCQRRIATGQEAHSLHVEQLVRASGAVGSLR